MKGRPKAENSRARFVPSPYPEVPAKRDGSGVDPDDYDPGPKGKRIIALPKPRRRRLAA